VKWDAAQNSVPIFLSGGNMSRVVHGVSNKMDNGRKMVSKKVVRRAVRRANNIAVKLRGE
jgi:hypothetical protein